MLAYTLNQLMMFQAVIERDTSEGDGYGAPTKPSWHYLLTAPCAMWWMRSTGVRSANREYVTPARTVPISEGGMILPLGTDITEQDRVRTVQDRQGNAFVEGIFVITAAINQETHMEIDITRTHVGQ